MVIVGGLRRSAVGVVVAGGLVVGSWQLLAPPPAAAVTPVPAGLPGSVRASGAPSATSGRARVVLVSERTGHRRRHAGHVHRRRPPRGLRLRRMR
ncbi:MAG TPA: hypothetical protein VMB72_15630 [Acidimicrobiales bacterium]|nr:hypothetical protein [Acidimicrobiales bacterium]